MVVLLATTAVATAVLWGHAREHEQRQREDRATRAATALRMSIARTEEGLGALRAVAGPGGMPTRAAFRRAGRVLLRQPTLEALTWTAYVPDAERRAYERRLRRPILEALPGRTTPRRAGRRRAYFPVTLIAAKSSATALGFDGASEPRRAAAIRGALETGTVRATAPLALVGGRPRRGFLLYEPILTEDGPGRFAPQGVVAGIYDARRLVASLLAQLPSGTRVRITDAGRRVGGLREDPPNAARRFVEVAGRRWTVTAGGPAGGVSLLPWLVALGGLGTAVLVTLVLHGALRRERAALAKVREKIIERDRAEERLRDAFATSPIGMAMLDLQGRFVKVNRAFGQITGYHSRALLETAVLGITHPDDVAAQRDAVAAMLGGKTSAVSSEMRYLHAGGRSVWVSINTSLVRDARGEPVELLQQIQDITERRRFEHKLQHMADHDSLTGLLNRRRFEEELDRHLAGAGRFGPRGAILMLDLDNFKDVNDSLGHPAGDELIATVAGRLRGVLRETDVVARLGGDEFAVLLPGARAAEAEKVAGKLLDDLRGATVELSGQRRRVSASLGIALIRGTGESADELMVNADMALYDAKGAGRDRVTAFAYEGQRRARMEARASGVERLEHALEHDGFALYAQPIVDLRTGAAVHHELLLRMRAEDGDLIQPSSSRTARGRPR